MQTCPLIQKVAHQWIWSSREELLLDGSISQWVYLDRCCPVDSAQNVLSCCCCWWWCWCWWHHTHIISFFNAAGVYSYSHLSSVALFSSTLSFIFISDYFVLWWLLSSVGWLVPFLCQQHASCQWLCTAHSSCVALKMLQRPLIQSLTVGFLANIYWTKACLLQVCDLSSDVMQGLRPLYRLQEGSCYMVVHYQRDVMSYYYCITAIITS